MSSSHGDLRRWPGVPGTVAHRPSVPVSSISHIPPHLAARCRRPTRVPTWRIPGKGCLQPSSMFRRSGTQDLLSPSILLPSNPCSHPCCCCCSGRGDGAKTSDGSRPKGEGTTRRSTHCNALLLLVETGWSSSARVDSPRSVSRCGQTPCVVGTDHGDACMPLVPVSNGQSLVRAPDSTQGTPLRSEPRQENNIDIVSGAMTTSPRPLGSLSRRLLDGRALSAASGSPWHALPPLPRAHHAPASQCQGFQARGG